MSAKPLTIYTRAEIRKGCVWEIQLKFSQEIIDKEDIRQVYIEKPRGTGRNALYLCLKVKSKLIKPPKELAFTKVATIVNENEYTECNESGIATLRVRFTARPRAVFHKHSDMMILMVSLKRGENIVCSDSKELIFRGGTGSMHSADSRNQLKSTTLNPNPNINTSISTVTSTSINNNNNNNININKTEEEEDFSVLGPNTVKEESLWPVDRGIPEFEDFDTTRFCADFLQNKGDALLSNMNIITPMPMLMPINMMCNNQPFNDELLQQDPIIPNIWASDFVDTELNIPSLTHTQLNHMDIHSPHDDFNNTTPDHEYTNPITVSDVLTPTEETTEIPTISNTEQFSVVFGKRRGSCIKCLSECSFYRGQGGQCNECGCFPSQHLDLDQPLPRNKRRLEDAEDTRANKKPRYLLEAKYFQKLFFNCLHYLSIQEISSICSRAPVPVFIKNEESVYIYMNSAFCTFMLDVARTERVLNKSTIQVLGSNDGNDIVKHDKYLMTQDQGTVKTFDVCIKKQNLRVMKQWTVLKDGKRVIIGSVISSY